MYIKVKASPGAKREAVERISKDCLSISVKERAERNMANGRIRELVARHFSLAVGKVKMVSGHHSRSKIFSVDIE